MAKANQEILNRAKQHGIYYWQIADKVGVNDSTFYRWIRHEFSESRKDQVLRAIDEILAERNE